MNAARIASLACAALLAQGCASSTPRLRLQSSDSTGAAWAFVLVDHGSAAQILVDGRPRFDECERAGVTLRCELRGMFPGGHTVELRLAGGVLRRSVVLGVPWSARPVFVRARDLATVAGAGHAGADGVLLPQGLEPATLEELVEAGHKAGLRVLLEVTKPSAELESQLERYTLDGFVGATIPAGLARRFPSTRLFGIDVAASAKLAANLAGAAMPIADLAGGDRLVEAHGALGLGLLIIAGRGAIIDGAAFPLLGVRHRHKALREGTPTSLADDGLARVVRMAAGGDAVTLVANAGRTPYTPEVELPPVPIDLLGGPMTGKGPTVPPGELAAILASPDPDRTRY